MKYSKAIQVGLAGLLYFALGFFILGQVSDNLDFTYFKMNYMQLVKAAGLTLALSLAATFSSMVLGFMLFLLMEARNVFLKTLASIYKEIIMGTPLLVLVFVVVYIIGLALGIRDKVFLGFLALTLYMSPYMANSFSSVYRTLDRNQFIVMDFYGFKAYQKYVYVILPQMFKPMIPGLLNNLSGIIKGTSILSTIAISEIFYTSQVLSNQSYRYQEGYFILWLVYLLITVPLSQVAQYISSRGTRYGN